MTIIRDNREEEYGDKRKNDKDDNNEKTKNLIYHEFDMLSFSFRSRFISS